MLKKPLIFLFLSLAVMSCGVGANYQENLERLDKVYGKCDNPHRNYTDYQYQICKSKESAGKEGDGINLTKLTEFMNGNSQGEPVYNLPVNRDLWNAALITLEDYSLKSANIENSYIETEWISNSKIDNQRCSIKVHFFNSELTATSLKTKFLCQIQSNNQWVNDNKNYLEEEKQLTLKILKNTNQIF